MNIEAIIFFPFPPKRLGVHEKPRCFVGNGRACKNVVFEIISSWCVEVVPISQKYFGITTLIANKVEYAVTPKERAWATMEEGKRGRSFRHLIWGHIFALKILGKKHDEIMKGKGSGSAPSDKRRRLKETSSGWQALGPAKLGATLFTSFLYTRPGPSQPQSGAGGLIFSQKGCLPAGTCGRSSWRSIGSCGGHRRVFWK